MRDLLTVSQFYVEYNGEVLGSIRDFALSVSLLISNARSVIEMDIE